MVFYIFISRVLFCFSYFVLFMFVSFMLYFVVYVICNLISGYKLASERKNLVTFCMV